MKPTRRGKNNTSGDRHKYFAHLKKAKFVNSKVAESNDKVLKDANH